MSSSGRGQTVPMTGDASNDATWTHCANCGEAVKADAPHRLGDCEGPTENAREAYRTHADGCPRGECEGECLTTDDIARINAACARVASADASGSV